MNKQIFGLLLASIVLSACQTSQPDNYLSVTYRFENKKIDKQFENHFILYNHTDVPLDKEWTLYFSQLPRAIQQDESVAARVVEVNANYFKIKPTENYQPLAPGDSLLIPYYTNSGISNRSTYPEGMYFVRGESEPIAIKLDIVCSDYTERNYSFDATRVYQENARLSTEEIQLLPATILPRVKNSTLHEGHFDFNRPIQLIYPTALENEAKFLQAKLQDQLNFVEKSDTYIELTSLAETPSTPNKEFYQIDCQKGGITIAGVTPQAVFNGCQTLLALRAQGEVPHLQITDYPDLPYRGMMLDIARNFTSVESLKHLIELLSSYKINKLHLHLSDDEGWRLEIPGLEELTQVGSKRGHTLTEATHLYPAYDGHFDPNVRTSGNGYYTRDEFIDLLKHAKKHHVEVIPEIDCPGHARAAIVAMNARYDKYINTHPEKALEYLLCDFDDQSEYRSAQWYTDNVMNVALPSTYRFIDKVFGELLSMYREAEAPIQSIHIGGDEVPRGAWLKSPLCLELMEKTGMKTTKDLQEYFFAKTNEILHKYQLKVSGWQEVALHNPSETDQELSANTGAIYCWNTVPEWRGDIIPYTVANKGYPVVLCNVNNLYIDLAYSPHPDERGLAWGGYVDEAKTFSLLPYSIYQSTRTTMKGQPVDLTQAAKNKVSLNKEAEQRILGVQVQLFSETIRGYDQVEYYVFPKIFGLVERGWNAHPQWEHLTKEDEQEIYYKDLSYFYAQLSDCELPLLVSKRVNFRIPHPGILIQEGKLYLNSPIRRAAIHYTQDGTEPTVASPIWTEPVALQGKQIRAKLIYYEKESVTSYLNIE